LIRENKVKEVKIVATTADQLDRSLIKRCKNAGFDDVISKPISRKNLSKILKNHYMESVEF